MALRERDIRNLTLILALYAHSFVGDNVAVDELLPEALPIGEHDFYILWAQFESWTTLDGWFGDASPLAFWMRFSDLVTDDYHKVWAVIRTD